TLCNMVVESGAKNGIMVPNKATLEYLDSRTNVPFTVVEPDVNANYKHVVVN
ncbi:hypothetical protein J0689_25355, partial [Vibrio parahaemolyticus]|nr:hypothetical protein [Vibrio parahaemolyticus]